MIKPSSTKEEQILAFIKSHPGLSSKEIHDGIGQIASYATVKRLLQSLSSAKLLEVLGQGRGTRYKLSLQYEMQLPIDPELYFKKEVDEREIYSAFNYNLLDNLIKIDSLFTVTEKEKLDTLQSKFKQHTEGLSPEQYRTEFERLAIDLSWKSSQIEGNTYSLLETERLLMEKEVAVGKTKDEATMLLNHKAALDFILLHPDYTYPLSLSRIEDLHTMLIRDLNVSRNIRQRRVGISGTNYKPLDNEYQIREAMVAVCDLINNRTDIFEKALLALILLSYIQPFEDGNKRTARILSNAILMNHHYCPMSFRTVDAIDYKKAMLIFYEKNNISAFKAIFIEQYEFAVNTYF